MLWLRISECPKDFLPLQIINTNTNYCSLFYLTHKFNKIVSRTIFIILSIYILSIPFTLAASILWYFIIGAMCVQKTHHICYQSYSLFYQRCSFQSQPSISKFQLHVRHGGAGHFFKDSLPIIVQNELSFDESAVVEIRSEKYL